MYFKKYTLHWIVNHMQTQSFLGSYSVQAKKVKFFPLINDLHAYERIKGPIIYYFGGKFSSRQKKQRSFI